MRQFLMTATALAALSLFVSGCAKPSQTETTSTTVALAAAPRTGDTSQTAALSAPANADGTTPSRGVVPPPSR